MDLELTQVSCLPSGEDGRSVELTLDVLAQAQVWCHGRCSFCPGSVQYRLGDTVTQEEHTLWKLLEQSSRAQNVRELLETGALPRSVVDSWVNLGEITQSREGGEVVLTGRDPDPAWWDGRTTSLRWASCAIPLTWGRRPGLGWSTEGNIAINVKNRENSRRTVAIFRANRYNISATVKGGLWGPPEGGGDLGLV